MISAQYLRHAGSRSMISTMRTSTTSPTVRSTISACSDAPRATCSATRRRTACPWCAELKSEWVSVEGRGTVHSYTEVHHAIQPAFKPFTPYLVLLVELDTQSGMPTKEAGLRVIGNLTRPDGVLAPKSEVEQVGIGTRVRMVFTDVAPGLALPQWTIDETAADGAPWRYRG